MSLPFVGDMGSYPGDELQIDLRFALGRSG
jgi:hypothetical protein